MARRKSVCLKWTLVLLIVIICQFVSARPQEPSLVTTPSNLDKPTDGIIRNAEIQDEQKLLSPASESESAREVKTKAPIRDSIKMVANQLLDKLNNTVDTPALSDTRVPPKLKTQVKHKIKVRNDIGDEPMENAHLGEAVPISMEDLDTENNIDNGAIESSTSNGGISTWILLSNPSKTDSSSTTEPTISADETQKKAKPTTPKNKPKRNQNKVQKRPIIGSTNKADLVAGGSAINENEYNKIKDTVLSNVQKNKNTSTRPTTTTTTISTAVTTTTETPTSKKETKAPITVPVVSITSKPKKKNKNKNKATTLTPIIAESALLPMEAKEQEIELEVSTPETTKKPKRSGTRKKTKTKKRKTSTAQPETALTEVKTSNKTKAVKPAKKPIADTGAITTQIYNYFSREVMPSVGVGVLGLASIVGIAGYFLYPFATPVRRTFEVDKSDDIYRNNAEEYANEGNGQAEEEMLGTVLAGMPAHAKQKLNPYAGQTPYTSRYPSKKDQDLRYRHVATSYTPNYKVHYAQQKTGLAHGAVYSKPVNYNPQYETRHVYTTEGKYNYEKSPNYTPYPAVEPIYAAPQTGPSAASSYGSDSSSSVVYGVKPSPESDFKPVYPYENHFFNRETTSNPVTYSPTSMYLGSNDDMDNEDDDKYTESPNINLEGVDNKFVVGNVPKDFLDSATPAVVPEHGPRKLRKRRSISSSLEELLAKKESENDIFISNEIDDSFYYPIRNLAPEEPKDTTVLPKDLMPVYVVAADTIQEENSEIPTTAKTEIVESVSTVPISDIKDDKPATETNLPNDSEVTTKPFKVYEVFPSKNTEVTEKSSSLLTANVETTTFRSIMTETTTELKSETTSTMPTSPPISTNSPIVEPTNNPDVITYPPLNQSGGFFSFLKRLVEFKYRLGLSILQTTSENLNKYLRSMEDTMRKVSRASA